MQQKNSSNNSWYIMGLFFALVLLVGCIGSQQNVVGNEDTNVITNEAVTVADVQPSNTPMPLSTPTASITVTASPSATLPATVLATSSPSHTPTATFTAIPTLTPLPTIPPQQRGQVYTELINSNGGCELPCWWGFELGNSTLDEVRQFYAAFDTYMVNQVGEKGISALYAQFVDPNIENGEQVGHTFVAQDGVLKEALIEVVFDPKYHIIPILQRLGQPAEIWMWTIPESYEGILPSRFRLYFPEQGVFILYASVGEKIGDNVNICFDGRGGTKLYLWKPEVWDPEGTKGIKDRVNEVDGVITLEGFPIEEVSNWDVEKFYTILTDPMRTECLETPSNLWSPP